MLVVDLRELEPSEAILHLEEASASRTLASFEVASSLKCVVTFRTSKYLCTLEQWLEYLPKVESQSIELTLTAMSLAIAKRDNYGGRSGRKRRTILDKEAEIIFQNPDNLTLREIAKKVGVSPGTISRWRKEREAQDCQSS